MQDSPEKVRRSRIPGVVGMKEQKPLDIAKHRNLLYNSFLESVGEVRNLWKGLMYTNVHKRILDRLIEGLHSTNKSARVLAFLSKHKIFDKKLIQDKMKQMEGSNVLLFTPKQSN